jgi:acetyltransferase-like isoleucine patch superfamily enzyme
MEAGIRTIAGKYFDSEPFLWGLGLFVRQMFLKIKSIILSRILHAPGIFLGPGCIIRGAKRISFGQRIYANRDLWLEAVTHYLDQKFCPAITIEDNVSFSDGVHITSIQQIVIKRNVMMGSRIFISDHNHGIYRGENQSLPGIPPAKRQLGGGGPVEIGECVWIGDNVAILGPVKIGRSSIIAANSVVRGDVPENTIVAGAPAKIIKQFNPNTLSWERV